ncbi:hypothetical protein [Metamycoplasma alkalescens]|uniref:hypothetical protein n=1 Tax=Metamycoplasma alkalescens TaxID=45363 RepID=UPI003CFC9D11
MKTGLLTHRMKLILFSISIAILFLLFFIILFAKLSNPYRVSIYNYESYLGKEIINKIKKNYSYHVFKNLDEFTRAIKNKKAVAGVSSDYQIAQLILENELKKINFKKVYGIEYEDNNKKEVISALYTDEVNKQFAYFDNWLINEIKKINPENKKNKPYIFYNEKKQAIGFDINNDGQIDNFYEFLIPYFTLDKMIVYNPENSQIAKKKRNNLKENQNFADIKDGKTWLETIKKLTNKYKKPRIYWTNWFLDNTMIGQFYAHDKKNDQKENDIWKEFNKDNYKDILNDFNEFVINSTGSSIKDINRNKLVTDGQELVSSIIEPNTGKADIAIMYNGDALDAYYGQDNFASLPEKNNISFVRPKDTYMNIDAWIISKDTSDSQANLLLSVLNENLYADTNKKTKELENQYLNNVFNNLKNKQPIKETEFLKNLFDNDDINQAKNLEKIDAGFFKENYEEFQNAWDYDNLPHLMNFHQINYSPSFKNIKNFLKKWYFLDDEKNPDKKALNIFDLVESAANDQAKINFRAYQPLNLELKTKMIEYYYQITNS